MITLSEQVDAAKMRAKMAIERARYTDDPMALLRVKYFLNDLRILHQSCPLLLQGRIETILKTLTRELESDSFSQEPIAIQIAVPTQDMSIPNAACY